MTRDELNATLLAVVSDAAEDGLYFEDKRQRLVDDILATLDRERTGSLDAAPPLDGLREALEEVMAVNHSPFLGSDGIRPCLCAVHEFARAALRDEGETPNE